MRLLRALSILLVLAAACGDDEGTKTPLSTGDEPSCLQIQAFADALLNTDIVYDYEPSRSPSDLASAVDVVFAGRLTGEAVVRVVSAAEGRAASYIGYGVDVTESVFSNRGRTVAGATVDVFVEFVDASDEGTDRYTDAAAAARGAWVAVFATESEPPGLVAAIEGFMAACDGGGLLGKTGSIGGWENLGSVAAVIDAVAAGSTSGPPSEAEGATAVWRLDEEEEPRSRSTSFTALVSRLGCSNGETGEILDPMIDITEEAVTVTFRVAPLPAGDYNCPGNDEVPVEVELGESLGSRTLIDGACLEGDAVTTSFCSDGATRWGQK